MKVKPKPELLNKNFIYLLISIASILLVTGGYIYYRYEEKKIRSEKYNELKAIAELKINQITQWQKERTGNANSISKSPFFSLAIHHYLRDKHRSLSDSNVLNWLLYVKKYYGYEDIFVTTKDGSIIFSTVPELNKIDSTTTFFINKAFEKNKLVLSYFYECSIHRKVHYDIVAPVTDESKTPFAMLIIRTNPADYLYPLVQSWPTPSKTAETLLVRKDGNSVLFLNELRHIKNTAMHLRKPISNKKLPATQAVLGKTGIFEGNDYRNVKVISDIRPVPETPWYMVTKVDKDEILASLQILAISIIVMVSLLILLFSTGVAWFYHKRQKNIYRNLLVSERKLYEKEEEFRTTLYSIGDGVITTDINGRVRQMNSVAENLTGWKESEAKNENLSKVFRIINEENRTIVESPVDKVLKEGMVVGLANHTLLISKDGREIPIADSGAPIKNSAGDITGVVMVFRDQTEDRQAELLLLEKNKEIEAQNEEYIQINEEYRILNEELNLAKQKAEESDKLKTAFLQNMSHEIRTPMNAIMGFSELLADQYNNKAKLEKYSQIITQRCDDLLEIINGLLDIAKIESGQLPVHFEECNLKALFNELTLFFKEHQKKIEKNHIKLIVNNVDNNIPIFLTDKVKLKQIFINLIGNAFKFTDRGRIEVGCSYNGGPSIEFYVLDTGMGIPLEKQEVIFERFTQLSQADNNLYGGTGLGLPIVKGLINLLGGKISLNSVPKQGSTFYFSLPFKISRISDSQPNVMTGNQEEYDLPNRTILIVEDDIYNTEYLKEILCEFGFNIIHTYYGKDAIEISLSQSLDLVLMDIRLPDIDGYEATRKIKLQKPGLKIIAQTAYASDVDRNRAFEAGCSDYLSKPIKREKLIALVKKHMIHAQQNNKFA
jgi:PAS domain S-box-containing protein